MEIGLCLYILKQWGLVGSPITPYIWDSRCDFRDAKDRIAELYNMSKEKRQEIGNEGRKWAYRR